MEINLSEIINNPNNEDEKKKWDMRLYMPNMNYPDGYEEMVIPPYLATEVLKGPFLVLAYRAAENIDKAFINNPSEKKLVKLTLRVEVSDNEPKECR